MSLEKIQGILYHAIGLDSETVGSETVLHAVTVRIKCSQVDNIECYYEKLLLDKNELKELIEEVVVPETWFFRDENPFRMLIKFVKDEWLKNNPTSPLRVLSVPCATGEEPYSIAMTLLDAGLMPSQIYIDAIDISQRNINRCKEARYRPHSFRGVEKDIQDRFFKLHDDNLHHPDILIKAMVNFDQASILDNKYISSKRAYDVVFCRNLLIYFDNKTQKNALTMLEKLLKPKGILFVGHAETGQFIADKNWHMSYKYPKAFATRKFIDDESRNISNNILRKPAIRTTKIMPRKVVTSPYSNNQFNNEITLKRKVTPAKIKAPDMEYAKKLADQGKFTEAESICLDSLAINKQDAKAYFLLAVIQLANGDKQKSSIYFNNVVYLEPQNVDALMYLATLTEQQGDSKQAQRLRERAERCKLRKQEQVK